MPTIELHGYSDEQQTALAAEIRLRLGDLDYADDIVIILPAVEQVLDLNGNAKLFLRVLTRSWMRAHELRGLLAHAADTELLIIDFYPRIPEE